MSCASLFFSAGLLCDLKYFDYGKKKKTKITVTACHNIQSAAVSHDERLRGCGETHPVVSVSTLTPDFTAQ